MRVPDPTAPTEWRPLPIESDALVPAAELFVTHELAGRSHLSQTDKAVGSVACADTIRALAAAMVSGRMKF